MTENKAQKQEKSQKPATLREWLQSDQFKQQIQAALPKHLSSDRFMRMALTALTRQPKLAECTQKSVFGCLLDLGSLGIEPDGRRAHLIPFWDKHQKGYICTLIVDYKGIVELVRRSGEVQDIQADVVRENDHFDFRKGKEGYLTHSWQLGQSRGNIIGAYSYVVPYEGRDSFEVMDLEEIEAIRKRSKSAESGPWVTDYAEMAKKTAFRRHSKWLPFSPETREKIEKDDDQVIDTQPASPAVKSPHFLGGKQETPQPETAEPTTADTLPYKSDEHDATSQAVEKILDLMHASSVTEDDLITWGHGTGNIDESIGSLEELAEADPDRIQWLVDNWEAIKSHVRGAASNAEYKGGEDD